MATETPAAARIGAELYVEILQFLYHEADLLDRGEFDAWLQLLDEDFVYEMPLTLTRDRSEQNRVHDYAMELFAENLSSLQMRIKRLHTEYAWAEDPPTRTRHIVSNVAVAVTDEPETYRANCAFAIFANRTNMTTHDVFVGHRCDVLRRHDEDFKIHSRMLWLDQAVVGTNSISIFF